MQMMRRRHLEIDADYKLHSKVFLSIGSNSTYYPRKIQGSSIAIDISII